MSAPESAAVDRTIVPAFRPPSSAAAADAPSSPPPSRLAYFAVFLVGLVFFALNEDFSLTGDSALYADYARNAKFDEITVHYGYYRLLWAVDRTIGAWLHVPTNEMVAHLNVVFGALTLPVALALAWHFLRDSRYALFAVVLFAVCGRVVSNATSGEIYMLQTLVVLSSFLIFVRGRINLAAIVAGLALYVSPLSVFAYFFFPAYDWIRERRLRVAVMLRLGAIALLVYTPFLIVHGYEMLFGVRGLLAIPDSVPTLPLDVLTNFPLFQFKAYTVLVLLALPLVWAWRRERALLIITAAVFVPHLYVISKLTTEDNVFILNTDLFFCCCLAAGARVLAANRNALIRVVPAALLVAHLVLMTASRTFFSFESHRGEAADQGVIGRRYLEGKDAALITDWSHTVTVAYYGRPMLRGPVTSDPLYGQMVDATTRDSISTTPIAHDLYVLETWSPSGLARLLKSRAAIERGRQQHSYRAWAKQRFGFECPELIQRGNSEEFELYRCQRTPVGTAPHGG
jgi:hypothetical protein